MAVTIGAQNHYGNGECAANCMVLYAAYCTQQDSLLHSGILHGGSHCLDVEVVRVIYRAQYMDGNLSLLRPAKRKRSQLFLVWR